MNGKQHAVLWLGLLLIIVRLGPTGQWSAIWGTITGGSTINFGGGGGNGWISLSPLGIPIPNPAKIGGAIGHAGGAIGHAVTHPPNIGPANGGITPGTNLGNPAAGIGAPV